jgi:regulator of sirC expression with transglutaminase-like and TPR domain
VPDRSASVPVRSSRGRVVDGDAVRRETDRQRRAAHAGQAADRLRRLDEDRRRPRRPEDLVVEADDRVADHVAEPALCLPAARPAGQLEGEEGILVGAKAGLVSRVHVATVADLSSAVAGTKRERLARAPRIPGMDDQRAQLDDRRTADRARFARLVARPEPEIDLAVGALLIAGLGRPPVADHEILGELDAIAERVRIRLDAGDPTPAVVGRLHDVLYRELGFRGPTAAEYGDPANSHLDEVVVRRVGLPISLAIVELEVAARVGLTLTGIGLPGHFIVGGPDGLLIDPADGGRALTPDDCQALIRRAIGDGVLFHVGMLRPTGRREILARVLRNLKAARLARRDWPAALDAIDLLVVLEPTDPEHGRDRGLLLGRMGRFTDAVSALGRYLEERPDAHDVSDVRQVRGIFAGRLN